MQLPGFLEVADEKPYSGVKLKLYVLARRG